MRINLSVPYSEKDDARRLGAQWDAVRKTWFVENAERLEPFLKWMPAHMRRPHEREKQAVASKRTSAPPLSRSSSEPFDFEKAWNDLDSRKTPGKPAKKAKKKGCGSNPSSKQKKAVPETQEKMT